MTSGDEATPAQHQTVDATGGLRWLILPASQGAHRASVAVHGAGCDVALDYAWGPEALAPVR